MQHIFAISIAGTIASPALGEVQEGEDQITAHLRPGYWQDIKLTTLSTAIAISDGNQRLLIRKSLYVEPFVNEDPLRRLTKIYLDVSQRAVA